MSFRSQGPGPRALAKAGLFLGHLGAVVAAPVLMIAGLGMTMSVVLLPFGLVFGLSGVLLLVWGLFGHLSSEDRGSGTIAPS